MIQDTFLQFCMEQGLFDSHQKVLLALSGGLDSMTAGHQPSTCPHQSSPTPRV